MVETPPDPPSIVWSLHIITFHVKHKINITVTLVKIMALPLDKTG